MLHHCQPEQAEGHRATQHTFEDHYAPVDMGTTVQQF